eukprot:3347223-Amphidinium_carterae.1
MGAYFCSPSPRAKPSLGKPNPRKQAPTASRVAVRYRRHNVCTRPVQVVTSTCCDCATPEQCGGLESQARTGPPML